MSTRKRWGSPVCYKVSRIPFLPPQNSENITSAKTGKNHHPFLSVFTLNACRISSSSEFLRSSSFLAFRERDRDIIRRNSLKSTVPLPANINQAFLWNFYHKSRENWELSAFTAIYIVQIVCKYDKINWNWCAYINRITSIREMTEQITYYYIDRFSRSIDWSCFIYFMKSRNLFSHQ